MSQRQQTIPGITEADDFAFTLFWNAYPKHVAKQDARKAWQRLNPSAVLQQTMLIALQRQMSSDQWQANHGQFVPHAGTWLRGRRWEDQFTPVRRRDRETVTDWRTECAQLHGGRCTNATFHAAMITKEVEEQ